MHRGGADSTTAAAANKGWPAFLTPAELQATLHRFPARKSLLGTRVRLVQSSGAVVEYVKKTRAHGPAPGPAPAVYYQRADCAGHNFPARLATQELPRGTSVPYDVTTLPEGLVRLHAAGGSAATYRHDGTCWVKITEHRGAHY